MIISIANTIGKNVDSPYGGPINVTPPVISGTGVAGTVLTSTPGTWTGYSGTLTYYYYWLVNGFPNGETSDTYTVLPGDAGKNISLEVNAEDRNTFTTQAYSNTILARDGNVPVNTVAPTISGSPLRGSTLTGTNGTWTSDTGITGYTYQWRRDGIDIIGATSITYVTVPSDIGKSITLNVIATDLDGNSLPATSNTIVCTPNVPINTVAPVISGTGAIGETLTSTTGTWTSPTTITGYLYQWYRYNGGAATLIVGETNNTYVLTSGDVSYNFACRVSAVNADGSGVYKQSSNLILLYDLDYKAVIDRGVSLGYTLPPVFSQQAQSQLITRMKSIGVWNKFDVFYNFYQFGSGSGGKEFATLNWKAPSSNQITMFNSIDWNSDGFFGNGTNQYLDTNFQLINGVNYTQNDASRYVYIGSGGGGIMDGNSVLTSNTIRTIGSGSQRINQGVLSVSPNFSYSVGGTKSIHRTSATNVTLFNREVSETRTVASAPITAANHLLLRSTTSYGSHKIAMFGAGASLVAENTAFCDIWSNYLNNE